MAKETIGTIIKVIVSILIIVLLTYFFITGDDWSMQIGASLIGILIILNIIFKPSQKRIVTVLYVWCAVLLILNSTHLYLIDRNEPYVDRATDITYEIRTALKNANGNISDMALTTGNHAWDKLYLLPPHTDVNMFLKNNSLRWYGDKKENIKYQDDTALLIFSFGNKVSCYAEIKREDSKTDFDKVVQIRNVINSFNPN